MTITIDLLTETEARVKTQALKNGAKLEGCLNELIEETSERREHIEMKRRKKTFAEILAPVHKGFEENEMSGEELTEFLEELRGEVRQEKQKAI